MLVELQRFRFPDSLCVPVPSDVQDELVNPPQRFTILALPIQIVVPASSDQILRISVLHQFVRLTCMHFQLPDAALQMAAVGLVSQQPCAFHQAVFCVFAVFDPFLQVLQPFSGFSVSSMSRAYSPRFSSGMPSTSIAS